MKRPALLLLAGLALVLSACAPTAAPTNRITTTAKSAGFYPVDTGLQWAYHRQDESLDLPAVQRIAEGPTLLADGSTAFKVHTVGRGLDLTRYWLRDDTGLYLAKEKRPGATLTYDPPLHAYPAPQRLTLGATWSGSTTVTVTFPDAPAEQQNDVVHMEYSYHVVDQRQVDTPAGRFTVDVIDMTATQYNTGKSASPISQEIWFTPHVGPVKLATGFYLTNTNATQVHPTQ